MKGSRLYMFFLLVFLVIVFLVDYNAPHQFEWKPTYDKNDKEPFGSFVFDDVMSSSIYNYTVDNKTFYQLFQADSLASDSAILLTENTLHFNETDIEFLFKLLHKGNRIMLCTDEFPFKLLDSLGLSVTYQKVTSFFGGSFVQNTDRDSIFLGRDTLNPERVFEVFLEVHPVSFGFRGARRGAGDMEDEGDTVKHTVIKYDSLEVLVWDNKNKPLVVRVFLGKGELFLVSTPLMFTNFGMLDGNNASYAFRLLSYLKKSPASPLVRIEAYGKHDERPHSPLRYILSEETLRWATYSILVLLILFMAFTAKRRQRIIPVRVAPPNRTLGFMFLISNLYYQKHDNLEILKMKYMFFCAEVKDLSGVDLSDKLPSETDYERLIEKSGMERESISRLLQNIQQAVGGTKVNDWQLKHYIDEMNKFLRYLKNE